MRRNHIIVIATALLASLVAIALSLGRPPAGPNPQVIDAWVRLPAVAGNPGAGYFTIRGGERATEVVAVSTPAASRVELHGSDMRLLTDTSLPAGGILTFAPGEAHAMLFDLEPDLTPGATLPLAVRFADGTTAAADAQVRAAGDPAPCSSP